MLAKIDLAYALNAHMAQGVTSDGGIAVIGICETRVANLRLGLVTATRVRGDFSIVADDPDRLARQLERNPGTRVRRSRRSGRWRQSKARSRSRRRRQHGPRVGPMGRGAAEAVDPFGKTPAKPDLECKIDDSSSRTRGVEFDL